MIINVQEHFASNNIDVAMRTFQSLKKMTCWRFIIKKWPADRIWAEAFFDKNTVVLSFTDLRRNQTLI